MKGILRWGVIQLLSFILTSAITLLYAVFSLFLWLKLPIKSNLLNDMAYGCWCCMRPVSLSKILHIIINTILSLMSALIIANYCQNLLNMVEWISHQTHIVFLELVFPRVPQISTVTPSEIVVAYLLLGYLGITAQISLTLDLLYLYNLPTILMYKILALSYSQLIKAIKFCIQVTNYEQETWLTCQYDFLKQSKVWKIVSIGSLLVMGQILVIVSIYYIWLALAIIVLVCLMNVLQNFIQIVRSLSSILLALKGYSPKQQNKSEEKQKSGWQSRYESLKKIKFHLIPLIKLKDIQDIFVGRDIIKISLPSPTLKLDKNFSIVQVYRCLSNS